MEAKHTPGPWRVTGESPMHITDADENLVAVARFAYERMSRVDELRANAALIAAAPELLAACEAALLKFKHSPLYKVSVAADMLRAAIAKATGK